MKFRFYFLMVFMFNYYFHIAQTPVLVQDFNVGEMDGFNEFNFPSIQLDNKLIFPIINNEVGEELGLLEDGELSLLKDINTGGNSSVPSDFVIFNDKVYFTATDEENGGGVWMTDGTEAGTELFFATGTNAGFIPQGLVVDNNGFMYFTFDNELYRTDGSTTSSIFTGADFTTTSAQASELYTRFNDEIAFLSKNGDFFELYMIENGIPVLLGETPEAHIFAKAYGMHQVTGGLIFGVENPFASEQNITYLYNDSTGEIEEFPIDGEHARRLHGLGNNELSLVWVAGKGYYATNGVADDTEILFASDNTVFPSDTPVEHGVFEENFIFKATEGTFGNDFIVYSDGTAAGTENLFQIPSFISNILVIGKFAFFADGTSNGFEPTIRYVNLEDGSFDDIYTYDASFASNSILLLGVQNNRLYYISNLDSEIGRELYFLDLDFMVGIEEVNNNLSNYDLKITSNSFEVAAERFTNLSAEIYTTSGILIQAFDGTTNVTYNLDKLKGLYILKIEVDGEQIVRKVFIR